mgnify:CR=1 FL=1
MRWQQVKTKNAALSAACKIAQIVSCETIVLPLSPKGLAKQTGLWNNREVDLYSNT